MSRFQTACCMAAMLGVWGCTPAADSNSAPADVTETGGARAAGDGIQVTLNVPNMV